MPARCCCPPQGLQAATWPEALAAVRTAAAGVKGSEMRAIAGKLADAESMVALKDLFNRMGAGDLRVGGCVCAGLACACCTAPHCTQAATF